MIVLALLVALALVVGGCGGSDDDNANEAYADSVCTAVGTWKTQMTEIVSGISRGDLSKAGLQSKLSEAESATRTLGTQLKDVPPPDSPEGTAAKQQVDQFSKDVTGTISTAESAVADLQDNVSAATIQAALALVAPQVKALVSSGQSTVEALKTAGGSLGSAFKDTESCQSLGGG